MRTFTFTLAFIGTYGALLGLPGWYLAIVNLQHITNPLEAAQALAFIALLISGYFVWWGWWFFTLQGRYPLYTPRVFWTISLIHHIATLIYLIQADADVWGGGDDPWWIPAWIIINIIIAAILLLRLPAHTPPDQSNPPLPTKAIHPSPDRSNSTSSTSS